MGFRPGDSSEFAHDETVTELVAASSQVAGNTVPDSAGYIYVSGNGGSSSNFIVLPPLKTGRVIRGYSTAAHGIRTPASSNEKINDVDSDGSQTAGITATYSWTAIGSPTGWVLTVTTKLGAAGTTVVPA